MQIRKERLARNNPRRRIGRDNELLLMGRGFRSDLDRISRGINGNDAEDHSRLPHSSSLLLPLHAAEATAIGRKEPPSPSIFRLEGPNPSPHWAPCFTPVSQTLSGRDPSVPRTRVPLCQTSTLPTAGPPFEITVPSLPARNRFSAPPPPAEVTTIVICFLPRCASLWSLSPRCDSDLRPF